MHRVELKVEWHEMNLPSKGMFLMHRVELKALYSLVVKHFRDIVPNAPCGVERTSSLCPRLSLQPRS